MTKQDVYAKIIEMWINQYPDNPGYECVYAATEEEMDLLFPPDESGACAQHGFGPMGIQIWVQLR